MTQPRRRHSSRSRLSLLFIGIIGLTLSIGAFLQMERLERQSQAFTFQHTATDHITNLESRLQFDLELLRAIQAFYASSNKIEPPEFSTFVSGFMARNGQRIQSIAWVSRPMKSGSRASVLAIEPASADQQRLHLDITSDLNTIQAMEQAGDSASLVTSLPTPQQRGEERRLLLFAPIYQRDQMIHTLELRRAHLQGFALIEIRVKDLLQDPHAHTAGHDYDLYLYDRSAPNNGPLHIQPASLQPDRQVPALRQSQCCNGPHHSHELEMGGRQWLIVARPVDPHFGAFSSWPPWAILLMGIAFTLLLLLYLRSNFSRSSATERLADERTRALSEQTTRFDVAVNGSGAGLWDWNIRSGEMFYSSRFRALLGYTSEEAFPSRQQSWKGALHPADRAEVLKSIEQHLKTRNLFDIECRMRTSEGPYRWFRMTGQTLWNDQDQPVRMAGSLVDIERTKTLESELRSSEQRTREIIDSMVDGIITITKQGLIQTVNPAGEQIFGYPADELIGNNVKMLMPEPYHSEHDGYLHNYLTSAEAKIIGIGREVRGRRKDGTIFPMDLAVNEGTSGGEVMFTGIVRDITERVQFERELSRFKGTLDATLDCVFMFEPESLQFFYVNRGAQQQVGYSEQELLTMTPVDIKPQIDEAEFRALIQPLIDRPEQAITFETIHRHRDGHDIPVEISLQYVASESGHPRFVAIVRDITERKAGEQELRRYTNRLDLATQAGGIGVWDYNIETGTLEWDEQMFALYGVSREQFPGAYEAWSQALHPEDKARSETELNDAIAGDKGFDTQFRVIWPDGQVRDISASGLVVRDIDGTPQRMIGVNMDITERNKISRMKNEFVSTVSHELRTPLTSIMGSLGLLRGGAVGELPEKAQHMINIAYNNSDRLVRLINDILDIEKIESGKLEFHLAPLDLNLLVARSIEANEGYAHEHGVNFTFTPGSDDCRVVADADRLTQVVTNLLSNAAKFSPEGGQVEVAISRTGDRIRVSVSDHGAGIPEAFHDRIFEKFSQADASDTRQKGGTGLGLNICKAIIERHNGQIDFDSPSGMGTTFYFDLTAVIDPQEAQRLPTGSDTVQRILVCESDLGLARLISMILEQDGYSADIAHDAQEVFRLLGERTFQAMILDTKLSGQEGLALFRQLREQDETRNLPIVIISGKADEERDELNGDAFCVVDWLDKPVDPQRLLQAVLMAPRFKADGQPQILHIEDDRDLAQVVAEVLSSHGEITLAENLVAARALLLERSFDLIILDLGLPDGRGETLLPLLKELDGVAPPVIIFSAHEAPESLSDSIQAVLLKSRTTNEELLNIVHKVVGKGLPAEKREES